VEQSKGLEVIKSKDMEVRFRKDQPWKRDPICPIDLSWRHKDLDRTQVGTEDKGQSGGSKLTNIKDSFNRIGSQSKGIRRREINRSSRNILPCDQSIRINWSGSKRLGSKCLGDDRNGRLEQSVGSLSNTEVRRKWRSGE